MKKYFFTLIVLFAGFRTAYSQCTADAGPEKILNCIVTAVILEGSSNVPAATYAWSGPGGFSSSEQNPTVVEAGEYSLTITDPSNNCTATALTSVYLDTSPPLVGLTGGTLNCNTPTVTIITTVQPPNSGFSWTGPNGYTSFTQNPIVINPGLYTVVVTNPANGCTSTASIVIDQDIVQPDVNVNNATLSCSNPVAMLTASSSVQGVAYLWSTGQTSPNLQIQIPGTYTVTVVAANGCTAVSTAEVGTDGSIPQITGTSTPVSCFGGSDGSIEVQVSGGVPQYAYLWSNGATIASATNLVAGLISLTVTDAVGCTAMAFFQISQPADISINPSLVAISPVTCFGLTNGSIALPNPVGGIPPYNYSWSGSNGYTASTKSITGLTGGLYAVTITDGNSCTKTFQFIVTAPAAPLAISQPFICDNSASLSISGGIQPFTAVWRLGSPTGQVIATGLDPGNLPPGNYFLVVSDNNGCTATAQFNNSPSSTPCTRISGQIILDENLNCQNDPTEPGLGNWFLQADGPNGTFYGLSGQDGRYTVTLEPGDYTLSLIPQDPQATICQNDIPITLAQTGDSTQVDFLVQLPNPDCPALSVDLSTPQLRRCFSNNYYHVQYCNNSPAEASDAYIILQLDPFLDVVLAQIPYTDLGSNLYRFDLGTVAPNFCDNFWMQVRVSCTAIIGQTHCSEAHIYPDTACTPVNPLWSGAQLEVRSECIGDSLRFILKNVGIGNMTQLLNYIVIEDGIMSRQGSAAPLPSGGEMTVTVPANGATWRIEVEQELFSPLPGQARLSVEGCSNTGSFSTGFVNQFPVANAGPWVDVDCTPNIGSWDPNDKQGFPLGYGADRYIRPGTELEYLIRFQNTGTDTAFNVVIRDTLSQWLDPLTIRAGASSHNYRFELAGEGVLIFDFQNILLPDSNVNEPLSHGFVKFSISPRTDVPLETGIPNSAAIYFDFNDPVITNTTLHRIGENFVSVGLWQPVQPLLQVRVTPHPLRDASWISVTPTVSRREKNYQLRIFDLPGKSIHHQESAEPKFLLRKNELPAGIYLFQIKQDGVLLGTGKLVVQ